MSSHHSGRLLLFCLLPLVFCESQHAPVFLASACPPLRLLLSASLRNSASLQRPIFPHLVGKKRLLQKRHQAIPSRHVVESNPSHHVVEIAQYHPVVESTRQSHVLASAQAVPDIPQESNSPRESQFDFLRHYAYNSAVRKATLRVLMPLMEEEVNKEGAEHIDGSGGQQRRQLIRALTEEELNCESCSPFRELRNALFREQIQIEIGLIGSGICCEENDQNTQQKKEDGPDAPIAILQKKKFWFFLHDRPSNPLMFEDFYGNNENNGHVHGKNGRLWCPKNAAAQWSQ